VSLVHEDRRLGPGTNRILSDTSQSVCAIDKHRCRRSVNSKQQSSNLIFHRSCNWLPSQQHQEAMNPAPNHVCGLEAATKEPGRTDLELEAIEPAHPSHHP
jgi:hypothetical protein